MSHQHLDVVYGRTTTTTNQQVAEEDRPSSPGALSCDGGAKQRKLRKQKVIKKKNELGEYRYYNPNTGEDVTEKVLKQKEKKKLESSIVSEQQLEEDEKQLKETSTLESPSKIQENKTSPTKPTSKKKNNDERAEGKFQKNVSSTRHQHDDDKADGDTSSKQVTKKNNTTVRNEEEELTQQYPTTMKKDSSKSEIISTRSDDDSAASEQQQVGQPKTTSAIVPHLGLPTSSSTGKLPSRGTGRNLQSQDENQSDEEDQRSDKIIITPPPTNRARSFFAPHEGSDNNFEVFQVEKPQTSQSDKSVSSSERLIGDEDESKMKKQHRESPPNEKAKPKLNNSEHRRRRRSKPKREEPTNNQEDERISDGAKEEETSSQDALIQAPAIASSTADDRMLDQDETATTGTASSASEDALNSSPKNKDPMAELYQENNQPIVATPAVLPGYLASQSSLNMDAIWSMKGLAKLWRKSLNFVRTFSFTDPQQEPTIKSNKHSLFDPTKRNIAERMTRPILTLTIKGADMLTLDENVVHPCVKVSVLDTLTGQYLKADSFNDKSNEVVLPQMTLPYNMKKTKSLVPIWNDTMYFDTLYNHFLKENVVFIFELVDFSFEKGEYKIAWGFLKPVSSSGRANAGKDLRIRLFKYHRKIPGILSKFFTHQTPPVQPSQTSSPSTTLNTNQVVSTNEAFLLYQHRQKAQLYPSTLYIEMKAMQRPPRKKISFPERPQKPNEFEIGRFTLEELLQNNDEQVVNIVQSEQTKEKKKEQSLQRLKLKREANEPCEIPSKLLFQFDAGEKGCICLDFSKSGQYLACGCHTNESYGQLKIYDVFEGTLVESINAHIDLIYSIDWNCDDSEIVTSSSDGTCKVWNVEYDKKKASNRKPKLVSTVQHPCYVYTARFHPQCKKIIASGSYDRRIRIFNKDTGKIIKELEGHSSRISSIVFDQGGTRMYSASGDGMIKIWSCRLREDSTLDDISNSFACMRTIQESELSKSTLTCIRMDPKYSQERLFIHSQDNMLRRLDTGLKNIRNRYHGVKCFMNAQKCNVSPDGQYLVSGSDIGRVYFWNVESEELIFKEGKDFGFEDSPVYDIAWSSKEHMVALCSFDGNQPIRVFCFEKAIDDMNSKTHSTNDQQAQQPHKSLHHHHHYTTPPNYSHMFTSSNLQAALLTKRSNGSSSNENPNSYYGGPLSPSNATSQSFFTMPQSPIGKNGQGPPPRSSTLLSSGFNFGSRSKTPDPFKLNPGNSLLGARPRTSTAPKVEFQ
ncbi:hypothetical protein C9374_001506 [Naegleria lovaniensis]|uniref:Guanine nucleotide-binding protein subunit beta-like protein n=1 Tax=Naegleria lovaniensis TaxID=51637 RepID=A0AA88KMQ4_NAELO|nr:uncharacterized protein C9374_001506 [Naegleria lovaniensis]KAG2387174.1 hypothetical protein C9374_001506 [Naegleria lovaniensis]